MQANYNNSAEIDLSFILRIHNGEKTRLVVLACLAHTTHIQIQMILYSLTSSTLTSGS